MSTTKKIILLAVLLCIFLCAFFILRMRKADYVSFSYQDQKLPLDNPYCGFYRIFRFSLNTDGRDTAKEWCRQRLLENHPSLILLEINLKEFRQKDIPESALSQLDEVLSALSGANHQLILRFLYDWDGNGMISEPDHIDRILSHMEQVAPYVNRYADHIHILQGIFTGSWAEMHNTRYKSAEDMACLMTHWAGLTDPGIYLSVRTPAQLRTILANSSEDLSARLGLFNDGILGSETDMGTYSEDTSNDRVPEKKHSREQELRFQELLCRHVPNGGEINMENSHNDLENALRDLSRMHVSYLNMDYHEDVIRKWKNTVFSGLSGYDYIASRLGYRYFVSQSKFVFHPFSDGKAQLKITFENTGFAPSYHDFDVHVVLWKEPRANTKDAPLRLREFPVDFSTKTFLGTAKLSVSLPIRELEAGLYTLSLEITDPATGQLIYLANDAEHPAAPLGQMVLY